MSLLTTTPDGQQVLTYPILTAGSDPSGIVFTQNPINKTVVLQDGDHGVPGTSGLQYIIEDPETGEGTLLDFANTGQQGKQDLVTYLNKKKRYTRSFIVI